MSTTHINEPTEPNAKSKDGPLLETISLRDYFAAKAMQALIHKNYFDVAAKEAYQMADAMLKARES